MKRYPSESVTEVRAISKPVAGTVRVYLADVEQLSGWSVDVTAGLITFGTAPAAGVETFRLHRWQQIPIVEVRA
jgi:uncharacterized protein (TIGR02217 family)